MKKHKGGEKNGIPDTIANLLRDAAPVEETLAQLEQNAADFDRDPEFVAGYVKARFLEDVLRAMHERRINKNQLARKLGKSRQYVGQMLNERTNFTVETMAAIACALGMRLDVDLLNPTERIAVGQPAIPAGWKPPTAMSQVRLTGDFEPRDREDQDGGNLAA